MELSERDGAVVRLVDRYGQVTATQIGIVLFGGVGAMPLSRCLRRLIESHYLIRVGRLSGPGSGGSGPYVYALGPKGWRYVGREGRYWPHRKVRPHSLMVVDLYVSLLQAERKGELKILDFSLECIVSPTIRADIYVEVGVYETKRRYSFFVEVDLGTERPRLIAAKLDGYWHAYTTTTKEVFPYVIFVVPDGFRASEIRRIVERRPAGQQELFRVCELERIMEGLLSL
jgi:hypothetical protein